MMRSAALLLFVALLSFSCRRGRSSATPSSAVLHVHAGVAVADLDGDGRSDFAVSHHWTRFDPPGGQAETRRFISYRLQRTGAGGFSPRVDRRLSGPLGGAGWIGLDDVNRDGRMDVLVTDGMLDAWVLWGDPSDQTDFLSPVFLTDGATRLAVADLSGDRVPDILVQGFELQILPQNAAVPGTFLPGIPFLSGVGVWSVALADLDQDGWTDVAAFEPADAGGPTRRIALVRQDDAVPGSFLPPDWYAVDEDVVSLQWLDADQDGLLDLAALIEDPSPGTGQVWIWKQDPGTPGRLEEPPSRFGLTLGAGNGARAMQAADLDQDGLVDLVVLGVGPGSALRVLWQDRRTRGSFTVSNAFTDGGAPLSSLAVGDLDADGAPDLITTSWDRTRIHFQAPGMPGSFLAPVVVLQR